MWGKTAVWPGDGGYAYVVTASQGGGPGTLQALNWGTDANGNPTMSQVGTSSDAFGYGSSAPAVTSNGTTSGSATLWTVWSASDAPEGESGGSESQLRAYDPVPVNGTMQEIWSAPIGVASKFLTPHLRQRAGLRRATSTASSSASGPRYPSPCRSPPPPSPPPRWARRPPRR